MSEVGAFGSGMAGGTFDPVAFLRNPQVILRLVTLAFSVIVFGCISSGGFVYTQTQTQVCVLGGGCGFGIAVGVLAFLAALSFLAADAYFNNISSVELRKQIVVGDLAGSGIFTGFYFIAFCYLTDKWRKFSNPEVTKDYDYSRPQAAIAFCFFSIFAWAALIFFAYRRFQDGAATAFAPSYDQDFSSGGSQPFGYPGGPPVGGSESYQEPPFTSSNEAPGAPAQFKPPAY